MECLLIDDERKAPLCSEDCIHLEFLEEGIAGLGLSNQFVLELEGL